VEQQQHIATLQLQWHLAT